MDINSYSSVFWELLSSKNQAIVPFLPLIAVLSGWIAAWAAIRSLNRIVLDTAANAFLELRAHYHTDDMGNAIKLLAQFGITIKEKMGDTWNSKLRIRDYEALGKALSHERDQLSPDEVEKIKSAVRRVSAYFDDVGFLLKHGIVTDKNIIRTFINYSGLNIFYEVCVPIYASENPHSPSIEFARLLSEVSPRYGEGLKRHRSLQRTSDRDVSGTRMRAVAH